MTRISTVSSPAGERLPLLTVSDLSVTFQTTSGSVQAVRDVSFSVMPGEILGIVGETGSGKSVTCKSFVRLLPEDTRITGSVLYDGTELLELDKKHIAAYRGKEISMIFQDSVGCLDPIVNIQNHMKEVMETSSRNVRDVAVEKLSEIGIRNASQRLQDYPFQFSGGMAQRVQIAMALSKNARLLIADEPTTALDVTIQAKILKDLKRLSTDYGLAIILISHDLGVIAETCDHVAVMYHGRIVENGTVSHVLGRPVHPYTKGLLASLPHIEENSMKLMPIQGECLPSEKEVEGCDFAARCPFKRPECLRLKPLSRTYEGRMISCLYPDSVFSAPAVRENRIKTNFDGAPDVLEVKNIRCSFPIRDVSGTKKLFHAVDDVSFVLKKGEILGIVGESGSGKTTVAKAIMGMVQPQAGTILFNGTEVHGLHWNRKIYATHVQYVFQDPLGALDPLMKTIDQVAEPLEIHTTLSKEMRLKRAADILQQCGMGPAYHHRKPAFLSGGQRQRVVLARAIILEPQLLVCDEPVSAMDVSVQAQILNLLEDLVRKKGMSMVFISHDLGVISNLCDRVAVMNNGAIVEVENMKTIFTSARHTYTRELIASIPHVDAWKKDAARRVI